MNENNDLAGRLTLNVLLSFAQFEREAAVVKALGGSLMDQKQLADHLRGYALSSAELATAFATGAKLATRLRSATAAPIQLRQPQQASLAAPTL
jgi:hypothetical protein